MTIESLIEDNRLKAEGGILACAVGAVVYTAPGWVWSTATANPFALGLALTGGAFAWCIRWEVREQAIQRWLNTHLVRWFVPAGEHHWDGWWEWADLPVKPKRRSATELHDEWLAEVGHELEEVA